MVGFLKAYAYNLVLAISQLVNALLAGDPDESLSSRLGKVQRGDFGPVAAVVTFPLRFLVDVVNYPISGWGHCARSIEPDEGSNDAFSRVDFD